MSRIAWAPKPARLDLHATVAVAMGKFRDVMASQTSYPLREPVVVTLGNPRQLTEKVRESMFSGPPAHAGVHGADACWGFFKIDIPQMWVYAAKASRRKDARDHLIFLAELLPYSQLLLAEAAAAVIELMRLDPRPGLGGAAYAGATQDWTNIAVDLVNVMESRFKNGRGLGLGDVIVLVERLAEIKRILATWETDYYSEKLAKKSGGLQAINARLPGATK